METILHIENITRGVDTPLSIGDTEYIFFGDGELDEDDRLGTPASNIRLGSPLETCDMGNTISRIPMVKTIGYSPDLSRDEGHVFTETTHYLKDNKYLIPFRTKIRSGASKGLRLNHLPSLNFTRGDIVGLTKQVVNPIPSIVSDLLSLDNDFKRKSDYPIMDWIKNDLISNLSSTPMIDFSFDTENVARAIRRYSRCVDSVPFFDMSSNHLREITLTLTHNPNTIPLQYSSMDVIHKPIEDFKNRLVSHSVDLRSFGRLNLKSLPMIAYNPLKFQSVIDFLDELALTDLNIDIILSGGEISLLHVNIAIDRITLFRDANFGISCSDSVIDNSFTPSTMIDILEKFVKYHPFIGDDIVDVIMTQPIKLKIVKTISDEAAVLLYRHDSTSKDDPLCGVYFDLSVLSLSPISIIPESDIG